MTPCFGWPGSMRATWRQKAGLYLSSRQLRDLATFNFEIGNHTYSHANCRSLSAEDFAREIDRNKAVLEAASGTKVRSFSVPYGSSADLTGELVAHLHHSGYEAVFLAESRANLACARPLPSQPGQHQDGRATTHFFLRLRSCHGSAQ